MPNELEACFKESIKKAPVVAILRGIKPEEAVEIGQALVNAGIKVIEVPLNSPDALSSIGKLSSLFDKDIIIGAGTVLSPNDVDNVANAGGKLIVTPNVNPDVIEHGLSKGLMMMPGFATATEALSAYSAGARHLKLFPAATYGVNHVTALKSVLPSDINLYAVGGVGESNAEQWLALGLSGLGIGGEIYRPGDSAAIVFERGRRLIDKIANQ